MEDALALLVKFFNKDYNYQSLNPCFNGRCTRTTLKSNLNLLLRES